jgi:hypothetical protein
MIGELVKRTSCQCGHMECYFCIGTRAHNSCTQSCVMASGIHLFKHVEGRIDFVER